ncbi:MAG: hypothetical protein ACLPQY_23645 [Streptosporangiaceae bacterium]
MNSLIRSLRTAAAIQQGDGNAEVGEQEGRGTPGRAGADDDDRLGIRGVLAVHGLYLFAVTFGGLGDGRRPAADGQGEPGARVLHAIGAANLAHWASASAGSSTPGMKNSLDGGS